MKQAEVKPDVLEEEIQKAMREALGVGPRGGPPFADWEQIIRQTSAVAAERVRLERERAKRTEATLIGNEGRAVRHMEDYRKRAETAEKRANALAEFSRREREGFEESLRVLRKERDEARKALADVLNYWAPSCQTKTCDKGYHVEALHAWQRAKEILEAKR